MKRGRMEAKDIPDAWVLAVVAEIARQRRAADPRGPADPWTFTWDIWINLRSFHPRVALAKLRSLVNRGLLKGCACGCRGDFFLTDAGKEAHRHSGITFPTAVQKYPDAAERGAS